MKCPQHRVNTRLRMASLPTPTDSAGESPSNDNIELTAGATAPPASASAAAAAAAAAAEKTSDDEGQGRNSNATNNNTKSDTNGAPQSQSQELPPYVVSHTTQYDEQLLHRATADAGRWAYGVALVELWVMNETRTKLFRPQSGWWVDPVYHSFVHNDPSAPSYGQDDATSTSSPQCEECQICRITCPDRPDYIPATPLSPGEGLPGVLWSEIRDGNTNAINDANVGSRRRSTPAIFVDPPTRLQRQQQPNADHKTIVWRQVAPLAADPDQPWKPRMHHLESIGFAWAAAVPFSLHGETGIIIYAARRDNMVLSRLRSVENETYLVSAASLIAAAYSLRKPRQIVVQARHERLAPAWERVRGKVKYLAKCRQSVKHFVDERDASEQQQKNEIEKENKKAGDDDEGGKDVEEAMEETGDKQERENDKQRDHCCKPLYQLIVQQWTKLHGANAQPPPSMTWSQSSLSFVGVFVSLTMLTHLNSFVQKQSSGEDELILGYVKLPL